MSYVLVNRFPDGKLLPYISDLRQDDALPYLHFPEEYTGTADAKLCCTQHTGKDWIQLELPARQQKKITDDWVAFLSVEKLPLERVQFCTRTPQRIFDAICTQESIISLRLKWCGFTDLSAIVGLRNLRCLYLGLGTSLADISPLAHLPKLEALCLDSTTKISDYSCLGQVKTLKALDIGGNEYNQKRIFMDSDAFLARLPNLEFLHFATVRIQNRSYLTSARVEGFRYACFRG